MGVSGPSTVQGQLWQLNQVYQDTARSEDPGDVADLPPHLSGCEQQRTGGVGNEGHPRHEVQCYGGEPHGCQNHRLLWV